MNKLKIELARLLCSGFYTGEAPFAAGTFGSFAYLLIWFFILSGNYCWQLIAVATLIIVGTTLTAYLLPRVPAPANSKKASDPSWIVIDEWAGLAIAFLAVDPLSVWQIIAAFALFRIFDASKIWPVSWGEKFPGAKGVMLDDIIAGAISAAIIYLYRFLT